MQQQKQSLPPSEMLSFGGSGNRMPDGGGGIISNEQAEAVSPISSRPPAPSSINFDDLVLAEHQLQHDHLNLGGGGGGSSSGNRWPRQETLTLLKIRSEMDVAFRDATLKGPLWDEVSRKLGELGYVRSAKKCKEKFENVHKYYKRTKESRAGRQDGKTYRFFNQLEAMQPPPPPPQPPPTATDQSGSAAPHLLLLPPVPAPQQHVTILAASGPPTSTPVSLGMTSSTSRVLQPFTMHYSTTSGFVSGTVQPNIGISFSSDTVFSDSDDDDDEDMMSDEDQEEREEFDDRPDSSKPKRKRSSSGSGSWKGGGKRGRMMDFFEGLMKQVMQKQEAMQQKFLETIEKREQDRLKREEAWKQHEAVRIGREQQLAAQERAMAASRDAAIVSFLHKITGQTIQLPSQPQPQPQPQPVVYTTTTATTAVHRVAPAPATTHVTEVVPLQPIQPQKNSELVIRQQQTISQMPPPPQPPLVSSEIIMAIPERQIPPSSQTGQELTSSSAGEAAAAGTASPSRWPKAEVLALIKLRSNLENRYQEAGPKGPLWEEISSGMQRIGYNRSSKRCKEKWENINKYFKKVKESNKKRPEDAKTCPYFNELDALYQRKKLTGAGGGSSSSSSMMVQFQQQQQQQESSAAPTTAFNDPLRSSSSIVPGSGSSSVVQHQASVGLTVHIETDTSERGSDGNNDQQQTNNTGGSREPEDIMMEQQKQLDLEDDDVCECDDISAEDEDDENDSKKESKIRYNNIDQFKRPRNNENGETPSSSSSSSFNITMVQ